MSAIFIAMGQVRIPAWVKNLRAYRRWAKSKDFPEQAWVSFLDGEIWVDPTMEQLITHNRVKNQFTVVVGGLVEREELGYFFSDRALLTNWEANLATEPDGLFASFEAITAGRIALVGGEEGFTELSGTPDMVLEIVSKSSIRKDRIQLRELYWKAGIREYWLVDARGETPSFEILRHSVRGYVTTRRQDGWVKSGVFGRYFKLEARADRLGNPQYFLHTK